VTYVETINQRVCVLCAGTERLIAYGQNITAGSHLSGLTRGFKPGPGGLVINTPNIENTLVGLGFGVMLRGLPAIFFCKQQDFLLLGIDHMVNTHAAIRHRPGLGSFTIFAIVVDSGFEGPQSSLHNLSDFCSLAQVPGFLINNRHDAETILERHLISPGFRIIGISQRLFKSEPISFSPPPEVFENGALFRYAQGTDATVVSFNLAFPQAHQTWKAIHAAGKSASLFSVNNVWNVDWAPVVRDVAKTGRLVILDDGKSARRQSDGFLNAVYAQGNLRKLARIERPFHLDGLRPNADQLVVDTDAILAELGLAAGDPAGIPAVTR
jgi:pyruvate/2-oxoglutarate/acetoin dehydrogenase E1 component